MRPGDFIITRPGPGMTTATPTAPTAASRWSGWTAWTSRCCASWTRASPRTTVGHPAVTRPEGDSMARYGHMAPVRHQATGGTSPIFNYPYERSRGAGPALPPRRAGPLGRRQAALPEPGHGRLSHAHHGHLHAAPARRLPGQDQPQHRLHRLLRGGRPRHGPHRRAGIPFRPARRVRGAVLAAAATGGAGRRHAVQLFRPPGAGRWASGASAPTERAAPRAFPFSDSPASEG